MRILEECFRARAVCTMRNLIPRKLFFQGTFCLLIFCFVRDRLQQSGVTLRAREINATLIDPGPECFKHASDTNHRANVARIQHGVQNWVRRVDPHNYTYIINPTDWCDQRKDEGEDLLLVIFVNSAPDHFLKRNLIRNTFGRADSWPFFRDGRRNQTMRLVFSVGAVGDALMQARLKDESVIFGDIVQENFTDDYLNMTLKTVMGFRWSTTFCSRARYVMKTDDDVLVNTHRVADILQKASRTSFSVGDVHSHAIVRDPKSEWGKFYTPTHLWSKKKFPPFFTGPAYIFSMDMAQKIFQACQETPLFPWSDVYVGMCSLKAGLTLSNQKGFIVSTGLTKNPNQPLPMNRKDIEKYNKLYTVFHLSTMHIKQLWELWTKRTLTP
ncbi:beta-1,3-galactosyltransferase 1-like [Lytechinus variegatus]|uniref:beta-1,3-galactosyltransferase 1-like n=1 Tax=Lytechinus variegatus TaxID=7654 RepID=UPI001BB2643C|nr:beta-1,3-galactosyltransferase 1-like [Lytechinus variegatus]